MELVPFAGDDREKLGRILEKYRLDTLVDVKNPFDITPMANDAAYAELVETILDADNVDALVVGIVPLTPALQTLPPSDAWRESIEAGDSICRLLPDVTARSSKPVLVVIDSGAIFDPMAELIQGRGLPVFRSGDRAMKALCRWAAGKLGRGE